MATEGNPEALREPSADEGPTANRVADAVSIASDFGMVWVLVSALQVLTRRSSVGEAVRRLGAAGVVSLLLTRVLKHHFAVPRDAGDAPSTLARTPTSTSFPSGHALAAFTSAVALPRSSAGRAAALAFAALVAWSRVRVGHHRPQDVVAGAAVGATAGTLLAAVLD